MNFWISFCSISSWEEFQFLGHHSLTPCILSITNDLETICKAQYIFVIVVYILHKRFSPSHNNLSKEINAYLRIKFNTSSSYHPCSVFSRKLGVITVK